MKRLKIWMLAVVLLVVGAVAHARSSKIPEGFRILIGSDKVVLLTTTWCGYCKKLRQDLINAGVPFREWDTEHSEIGSRARERLGGGKTVPVTIIDEDVIYAYKPKEIIARVKR